MPDNPSEPTNLVLEQLRLMRAAASAFRSEVNERFDKPDAEIAGIKKDIRGFELNTIAEFYEANLSVATLYDHERRIQAREPQTS